MKYLVSLFQVIFINTLLFGQTTTYTGMVYDVDLNPIPGIVVYDKDSEVLTETNGDGKFKIDLPETSKVLTFSFLGFRTLNFLLDDNTYIEVILKPSYTHEYPGIWANIGSFSDVSYAPYGIEISNGQSQVDLLHFEDFQEDFSIRLALATNFDQNLTYEAKLVYHRRISRHFFFDTGLSYFKKDYDELEFEELSIDTNIVGLRFFSTILIGKFGLQTFDGSSNFGGGLGVQSFQTWGDNLYESINFGGIIGYWNDYYAYDFFLNTFIYRNKISLHLNYKKINKFDFFTVGVQFLFKTKKEFDLYYNQ